MLQQEDVFSGYLVELMGRPVEDVLAIEPKGSEPDGEQPVPMSFLWQPISVPAVQLHLLQAERGEEVVQRLADHCEAVMPVTDQIGRIGLYEQAITPGRPYAFSRLPTGLDPATCGGTVSL
jgi:hypothetical protein